MKRLFPSFMLAAALFALAAPPQANAAQQALNPIDHDALVSSDDPADLAAVNGEGIHVSVLTDIDGNGLDRTVNMASSAQTLGAFPPRTRAHVAGNGIKEKEFEYAVEHSQAQGSPTYIEPDYYVADRSPDHRQRAYARCPRLGSAIT